VIALSPSAAEAVQRTRADWDAGSAVTPVGADGATAVSGVIGLECDDTGPDPFGLTASTVNVYVVPVVRPVIVVLVSGGEPVTVVGVCGAEPTYGVTLYEVTDPPPAGADHVTVAEVRPASTALTPVTWPGTAWGVNSTSTQ
jgi:hypothetical protein